MKLFAWFLAIFMGALGWWVLGAVLATTYGLPRASYAQALSVQVAVQFIIHATFVALGMASSSKEN